jgi:hypothetical protein
MAASSLLPFVASMRLRQPDFCDRMKMVSLKSPGFHIPESLKKSLSFERIKVDDDGGSEHPFVKLERTQLPWSFGEFGS